MMRLYKLALLVWLTGFVHLSYAQSTQVQYLSGTDKDHTVAWDFFCTGGRNSGKWTQIPVPSCWELQGFGTYSYGGENWGKQPSEEGLYKHTFGVPADWKNKKIFLVFEGAMTDTEVKVNGQLAGPVHQGGFYQFRYDITQLIQQGMENRLEVKVSKNSANESINRAERYADFWIFGGIYRPVYLEAYPQQFIERTALDARADGSFRAEVYLNNVGKGYEVEAQITTLSGEKVGSPFSAPVAANPTIVQTSVTNPQLWSSEFPNLYRVEYRLKKKTQVIHSTDTRFGFRTVELRKGDGFYVNGAKIRFKGANRHSFWPTSGRTLSKELSVLDVKLLKEMNMNAVRMSHYPPDQHFLDVCDSLGLFVLDELTGWQKAYDTTVARRLVKELIVRDVNHPSIVIWDNGNEGGNNHAVVDDYALYDPQKRIVIHPWNIFRGTDTQHYRPYDCCPDKKTLFHGPEVFFPTEFLHGLYDGGAGAGLDDFWKLAIQNPKSAGGFLWVFGDECVVRTDRNNELDGMGNLAPDGIMGPYREKEGSFYTIREVWSPVVAEAPVLDTSFKGSLSLENRYHYTNLNQCRFTWKLMQFPGPYDANSSQPEVKSGTVAAPDVKPGARGTVLIPLPENWQSYQALSLTATDPHGQEVFTWTWPIRSAAALAETLVNKGIGKASGKEEKESLVLSAGDVTVRFDKKTGLLQGVTSGSAGISFGNGPVLASGKATFQQFRHRREGNDYVVEAVYTGDLKKVTWRMQGNGLLRLDYAYRPDTGSYPYLGISFDYPENKVKGARFLGRGPYRVWKNRLQGPQLGVWEKTYNNTVTGESWTYPEFKGYHADFQWVLMQNEELPFRIMSGTDGLFLRLYTPEKPKGAQNENTSPPFPSGNLSFLHGISAIGTKFSTAESSGPQGQPNRIDTQTPLFQGTLFFDFNQPN